MRPQDLGGPERVVKVLGAMEQHMNNVPGFRRGHARGVAFRGHFRATPEVAALTTAEHLQGRRIDVVVRCSNGGASPYLPDRAGPKRGNPLGLGVRFELPSGDFTTWTALNLAAFAPTTPDDFHEMVLATRGELRGGSPNPLRLVAFLAKSPRGEGPGDQGGRDAGAAAELRDRALQRLSRLLPRRRARAAGARFASAGCRPRGSRHGSRRRPRPAAAVPRLGDQAARGRGAGVVVARLPARRTRRPGGRPDEAVAGVAASSSSPASSSSTGCTRTRLRSTATSSTRPGCRRASSSPTTRCCTSAPRPTPSRTGAGRARSGRRSCRSSGRGYAVVATATSTGGLLRSVCSTTQ